MTDKELYRELCEQDETIPLFSRSWWLDTICGEDGWDVVTYTRDGKILAALPFTTSRRFGQTVITQPKLTQTLGVWYAPSTTKYAKRLGQEKDMISHLVSALPDHHIFFQSFHHSFTNWLPFYFLGFEQTTKYTYVIDDLSNIEKVWSGANSNIKSDVRKAKKNNLRIVNEIAFEDFYAVLRKTYSRQGLNVPISFEEFTNIAQNSILRGSGRIFGALDDDNRIHAVAFLVWDKKSAYYLIGGGDPELRNSGSASLCVWEAIKFSSEVSIAFDFEGSMVEGIERFFRGFGAKQKQYFRIMKFKSLFATLVYHARRYRTKKI